MSANNRTHQPNPQQSSSISQLQAPASQQQSTQAANQTQQGPKPDSARYSDLIAFRTI